MNNEQNIITLNNRDYQFNCVMTSTSLDKPDETNFLPIAFNNVEQIIIDDMMFDPFLDVTVSFNSGYILDNVDLFKYNIKANNNNVCYLGLKPVIATDKSNDLSKLMSFNFIGVVNDIVAQDYENTLQTGRCAIKLIDEKEASLKERKVCKFLPTVDSGQPVGANIKTLLKTAIKECKFGDFEEGSVNLNTNYIYPIYYNFYDAINFLLPFNITEKEGLPMQTFLRYDTENHKFNNITITDAFLNFTKEEYNLESFSLGMQDGPSNQFSTEDRPTSPITKLIPRENGIQSATINNVGFSITNDLFVPYMVSNTTNFTNTSQFKFVDLKPELDNFNNKIIKKMNQYYSNDIRLNVDLDASKVDKNNYKVITSPFNNDINVKVAKAQMYSSFIMHNMSMTIVTNGQLYRQPGKFINIVRPMDQKAKDNAYERKVYGQWLVTDVKHVIRNDGYYKNVLQCVKPFINF